MSVDNTARIAQILKDKDKPSLVSRLSLVASLSWPAIMAQLSSILMEYIDASMVGSLGASASASIGLVATTTWLFWGLGGALSTGFSVQVAHYIGARRDEGASEVFRQSLLWIVALGVVMCLIGVMISGHLPLWLGGNADINAGASAYFCIIALSLPWAYLAYLSSSMLRCSGNMLVPGLLNVAMCVMDVMFNYFLIFDHHDMLGVRIPAAGLGVMGAAIGTALAELITCALLLRFIFKDAKQLNRPSTKPLRPDTGVLRRALTISAPIAAERILMCGAQIITTVIVAPIGTVAIAANAFGITAEGLCYMPGYGISDAATTLVGQSIGAGRRDMARSFGKITIVLGMLVMTVMGVVMWVAAPLMMSLFTPDEAVRQLGTEALRIEAYAEPMFAASIVTYGVMVGAGYSLVPSCINLGTIWVVRITLAALLAPQMGLQGVWLAMCIELCVRGLIYLIVFVKANWMKNSSAADSVSHIAGQQTEQLDTQIPPYEL